MERLRGQLALLENSLQDDPQNLARPISALLDTERLTGDAGTRPRPRRSRRRFRTRGWMNAPKR
ncbi:MAG: hypothetical protein R3E96_12015 [Planctomycetota bacterium]